MHYDKRTKDTENSFNRIQSLEFWRIIAWTMVRAVCVCMYKQSQKEIHFLYTYLKTSWKYTKIP